MIYDNLKLDAINLLHNTPVPLTKSQIAKNLNVPDYWVDKILHDIKNQVKIVRVSPARVGYIIP